MINKPIITSKKTDEENVVTITVTVSKEDVTNELINVYKKKRSTIDVPGFSKGKAPRPVIEKMYGKNIFLEDAVNTLVNQAMEEVVKNDAYDVQAVISANVLQAAYDEELIFTIDAAVSPEVTLGEYKGLTYQKKDDEVSEEELTDRIARMLSDNATLIKVNRPVCNGDTVRLNFKGFVDGVAFEGGEAQNYELVIGSHSFIDGFEDQLIGVKENEDVSVNVVFPENYQAEELQGKPAVFECTVLEVCESVLPEADDKFARTMGFDTFELFKEDLKNNLTEDKKRRNHEEILNSLVYKAVSNSKMHIPEVLINNQAESEIKRFEESLSAQGLSIEDYYKFTGQTEESLMSEARPAAKQTLSTQYVLSAIAEKENITVTDEEIDKVINETAGYYGMTYDDFKSIVGDDGIESMVKDLKITKAMDLIYESAVEE